MTPKPNEPTAPAAPLAVPAETFGAPGKPRIVLIHGFTQNRHCWGPLPAALSTTREVVAVDAPGHGDASAWHWSLADAAGPYADALAPRGPVTWLGYSMGGRLALHVALARPDAVAALVLVGASPGIADPYERAQRRTADEALADHLEAVGTAAFVDEWLAQDLFAGLGPGTDQRAERLANPPDGLAASLRLAGTGAQASLWDDLERIEVPVLVVVGEHDAKFRAVATAMASRFAGRCDVGVVKDAGHACHLEAPEAFSDLVTSWLDGLGQAGTP